MEKIYLPIASYNLGHYFSMGCICPTRYISNRNEDIQNRFDNSLLFCSTKFTDQTNCSLEIVLTSQEIKEIKKEAGNFFIFNKVLPITRVKGIYFIDEGQKIKTIANINDGAAFIPGELVELDITNKIADSNEIELLKDYNENQDWSENIELFDKLMGGFAFMRLGGKSWMNYSLNYFETLSTINGLIKEYVDKTPYKFEGNYDWLIFKNGKYQDLRSSIYSKVNNETVELYASKDKVKVERKLGIINLEKVPSNKTVYLISILATYGEGGRKKIDDLILDLTINKFPEEKKEGVSLIFGINSGYRTFRNKYKTSEVEVDVKFKLDSQLDYYTIESIYQFVFNNITKNYSFFYLDSWCPKSSEEMKETEFETYKILDKTIIYKKRVQVGSFEYFQELYKNILPNNLFESITKIVNGWLPDFLKTEKIKEANLYFEKNLKSDIEAIVKNTYRKVKDDVEKDIKDQQVILKENVELKKRIKELKDKYDELLVTNENLMRELDAIELEPSNKKEKSVRIENEENSKENYNIEYERDENSSSEKELKYIKKENTVQGQMVFPKESIKDDLDNRLMYLKSLKITKLKEEAKKIGIKSLSRFRSNSKDIERLANIIIEKESNSF